MNKKFLISWVAIFVLWMLGSFAVHGVLLQSGYASLPNLFRPQDEAGELSYILLLAHIVMAGAFSWIYQRGQQDKAWLPQGIRFGIAIALLGPVPMYSIYYMVQPLPGGFVVQQVVFESVLVILLGVAVAFINRGSSAPTNAGTA